MKSTADLGMNRTGIGLSPLLSREMTEGARDRSPATSGEPRLAQVRIDYASHAEPVGSVPPPSSAKGIATVAKDLIKGQKPTVFLDRLGERLAFERTGSRLYETLLAKFDAVGSWEGGPQRSELTGFRDDELRHFDMLREVIEGLGADPTVMTPSADLAGVESSGVIQALADPRTNLAQGLHAILVAELVDHNAWEALIQLSTELGNHDMAARFRSALLDEDRHLQKVREWLTQETSAEAHRELHAARR